MLHPVETCLFHTKTVKFHPFLFQRQSSTFDFLYNFLFYDFDNRLCHFPPSSYSILYLASWISQEWTESPTWFFLSSTTHAPTRQIHQRQSKASTLFFLFWYNIIKWINNKWRASKLLSRLILAWQYAEAAARRCFTK